MIVNFQFLIILCKRLPLAVDMISFVLKLKIEGEEEEEESSHILTVSKNTHLPSTSQNSSLFLDIHSPGP